MDNPFLQDISDLSDYLNEHAKSDFRNLPEGGVHALLAGLPPPLQQEVLAMLQKAMGDSRQVRDMPFQDKPNGDHLDPQVMALLNRLLTEETAHGLNRRMGTPTAAEVLDRQDPPSLRDDIARAFGGE
jgi:hypothetical protein